MKLRHMLIFVIAFIFTGIDIYNNISTYKIAERSSEELLESTAYFIGITLDQALNRTGIDEALFLDVIKRQRWEGIAFIALYDKNGIILLHSSKRIIGGKIDDLSIDKTTKKAEPVSSYLKLKTSEEVYVMDIPVHIHAFSPSIHLLRVALHTYPARGSIRSAKIHIVTAFVLYFFLWMLAFYFYYYSKKADKLHRMAIEKAHFTNLGEMAAVLAHEIRSPLGAIKGFAQYIREKSGNNSSVKEGLDVIVSESKRLENLTEELLVYARTRETRPESFSLTKLLDEVVGMFISDSGSITIKKDFSFQDDIISTDREKLRHILINILQNAIDSIEIKGFIEIKGSQKNDSMSLSIKDTGKGMDEETLKNVLKPFFTTKAKGTGLGLSIVENLIKVINGTLSIVSQSSKGTTVTVTFPREFK